MFQVPKLISSPLLSAAFVVIGLGQVYAQQIDTAATTNQLLASNAGPTVATLASQNALNISPANQIPAAFDFPAASVQVAFDGNTHILTAEGMYTLRALAVVMQDNRLSGDVFQVASHSAASSDPVGANRLTALRAQAVVEHLVSYYGISPTRLVPVGYGGVKPFDASNPASPLNDRIEIINVLAR